MSRSLYREWRANRMTRLGEAGLWVFYEHPLYGDEAPIVAERGGVLFKTDWWEVPTPEEVADSPPTQSYCDHQWVEACDGRGNPTEPARDICTQCGVVSG